MQNKLTRIKIAKKDIVPEKEFGYQHITKYTTPDSKSILVNSSSLNQKELFRMEDNYKKGIAKLEVTENNVILLIMDGQVYAKGKGECIGRERKKKKTFLETLEKENEPEPEEKDPNASNFDKVIFSTIEMGEHIPIRDISAGRNHVLALDSFLTVWGWGQNNHRQVLPGEQENYIWTPKIIELGTSSKVSRIFARGDSSFAVFQKNKIISWGAINLKKSSTGDEREGVTGFAQYGETNKIIEDVMIRDTTDLTDNYIEQKKIIHKCSAEMDKIFKRRFQKEKLESMIKELQEEKKKIAYQEKLFQSIMKRRTKDKKVLYLDEIQNELQEKIDKIEEEKNKIRSELTGVNSEISELKKEVTKNKDLVEEMDSQIQTLENVKNKTIEDMKNDGDLTRTELKLKSLTERGENPAELIESDINQQISNKDVFKIGLENTKKSSASTLEVKEKRQSVLLENQEGLLSEECEYLKTISVLRDIQQLINESKIPQNLLNKDIGIETKNKDSMSENKELVNVLLGYNKELTENSFLNLVLKRPEAFIQEILIKSTEKVFDVTDSVKKVKAALSEIAKQDFKLLFALITSKCNLIEEQNNLIKIIYELLSTLDLEYIQEFMKSNSLNNDPIDVERLFEGLPPEELEKRVNCGENLQPTKTYLIQDLIMTVLRETLFLTKEDFHFERIEGLELIKLRQEYVKEKIEQMMTEEINQQNIILINEAMKEEQEEGKKKRREEETTTGEEESKTGEETKKEEEITKKGEEQKGEEKKKEKKGDILFENVCSFTADNDIVSQKKYSWQSDIYEGFLSGITTIKNRVNLEDEEEARKANKYMDTSDDLL
ncbi:MAG: hypothetical protein MJ252_23035 [archaeon]|nr:hypothetical protein [archaeon]